MISTTGAGREHNQQDFGITEPQHTELEIVTNSTAQNALNTLMPTKAELAAAFNNSIVKQVPSCFKKIVLFVKTIFEMISHYLGSKKPLPAGFEFSSWWRIVTNETESEIHFEKSDGEGRLFLSAMPNKNSAQSRTFVAQHQANLSVLSINEDWEVLPRGDNIPFNWQELNVNHKRIASPDHEPLTMKIFLESALWIGNEISNGKTVLTHCRAGKGRSAMAEAAFLILFKNMSAKDAIDLIKRDRSVSTIRRKQAVLEEFEQLVRGMNGVEWPQKLNPEEFNAWIASNQHLFPRS